MDLLVNDLSLHGQFHNLDAFRGSIGQIMKIREVARRYSREVYCHRGLVNGQVTPQERMPEAVNALPLEERRAVMSWLSRYGPFWDDDRLHDEGDWYECGGEVVTDTAVGEVAHCLLHTLDRGLVSLQPSNFTYSPVLVDRLFGDEARWRVDIRNFWLPEALEAFLATTPTLRMTSWAALAEIAVARFTRLTFADDTFNPLQGHPFKQAVAERVLGLLGVLQGLREGFDQNGTRTAAGHALYQQHFTGDKAWFSDSSDTEKHTFKDDLTFPHPETPGRKLFCTWHGKVKSPQYRIHFSWPVTATTPVYVVYVGPKKTKR